MKIYLFAVLALLLVGPKSVLAEETVAGSTPALSMRDEIKAARAKDAVDQKADALVRPWDRGVDGKRPWDRVPGPDVSAQDKK